MERITSAMINEVIARGEAVRISDVASRLYTTNKQAVRKQMNKMVCRGQLSCEKFKYIGNADICVYKNIIWYGPCFVAREVNLSQSLKTYSPKNMIIKVYDIGKVVKYNGVRLQVKAVQGCRGCYFKPQEACHSEIVGACCKPYMMWKCNFQKIW